MGTLSRQVCSHWLFKQDLLIEKCMFPNLKTCATCPMHLLLAKWVLEAMYSGFIVFISSFLNVMGRCSVICILRFICCIINVYILRMVLTVLCNSFLNPHCFFLNNSFKRTKKYDWGSTRLYSVENSLWKRLWTCHKIDYLINVRMNELFNYFFNLSYKRSMFVMWISDETDSFCGDIQTVQNLNWPWMYSFCVGVGICCICSYCMKVLI